MQLLQSSGKSFDAYKEVGFDIIAREIRHDIFFPSNCGFSLVNNSMGTWWKRLHLVTKQIYKPLIKVIWFVLEA